MESRRSHRPVGVLELDLEVELHITRIVPMEQEDLVAIAIHDNTLQDQASTWRRKAKLGDVEHLIHAQVRWIGRSYVLAEECPKHRAGKARNAKWLQTSLVNVIKVDYRCVVIEADYR